VSPYEHGNRANHDPKRPRRLLMHKREILRLQASTQERGYTLVPLRMYIKQNRAKVEIGLARGKKLYDKRAAIAERDSDRAMHRALKGRLDE